MATDLGIRVRIDASELGTDKVPEVLRKLIQTLESRTLAIGFAATYTVGDRAYNLTISVGTISATDVGFEVLIDSTVSADDKAALVRKILQVLESESLAVTYAATYSAGSTSVNQVTLTVT